MLIVSYVSKNYQRGSEIVCLKGQDFMGKQSEE